MEVIGGVSAIAGLVATAATVSKSLYDIASNFKDAKAQIQAFSIDLEIFGKVLDRFNHLSTKLKWENDPLCQPIIVEIVDECSNIFSQLTAFNEDLFSKSKENQQRRISFRGKTKNSTVTVKESDIDKNIKFIRALEIQNAASIRRLEKLETSIQPSGESVTNDTNSIATYSSARSVATLHDSIQRLCISRPDTASLASMSVESFSTATEQPADITSASQLVNQFLDEVFYDDINRALDKVQAQVVRNSNRRLLSLSSFAFRQCSPSVMGLWAGGTRRLFRQRELRFEVIFETPVIFLAPPDNRRGSIPSREILTIDGSDRSYDQTNTMLPEKEREHDRLTRVDDGLATWVRLLAALQREEAESRAWDANYRMTPRGNKYYTPMYTLSHMIQKMTRSRDSMPAGIINPYAETTLSHYVELFALLGMHWKTFDITRGILHAQGNNYVFTSSLVPGFGILATFSVTGRSKFLENRVIPSWHIKQWAFGFVPIKINRSIEVGTADGIKRTTALFQNSEVIFELYEQKKNQASALPAIFELIGMLGDPVRIRGSNFRMIPNPTSDKWPGENSMIDWVVAMPALYELISTIEDPAIKSHKTLSLIFNQWHNMNGVWRVNPNIRRDDVYAKESGFLNGVDIDMREAIHDGLDCIDGHLHDDDIFSRRQILGVVGSHFELVMKHSKPITESIFGQNRVDATKSLIRYYIETIRPEVVNHGPNLTDEAKHIREAVWIAIMFRMICWFLLHDFHTDDANIVPSELMGSRMPIYIS